MFKKVDLQIYFKGFKEVICQNQVKNLRMTKKGENKELTTI